MTAEHIGDSASESHAGRFTLDTVVEEEGANLSVGEVSGYRLCCALDLATPYTALPGQLGSGSGEGEKTSIVFLPNTNLFHGNSAFGYYCEPSFHTL